MYLNDLTSAKHSVEKLNRILADSFNHEVDLSSMNMDSLNRMLNTTEAKMMAIKESDLKYWENPQYNKLGLIQHQLKTYINEVAPTRTDGKKMKAKTESVVMEDELEQAEVLLAAQELVDELQKMVEDIAEMQVQKLMPIVDAMKEQVGFEQAEAYNNAVDAALGALLDQSKSAKESVENATLAARGEAPATPMPTDMGMDAEDDMDVDVDMSDDFDGDDAAAGEDNAIGRELKGESAIADMEGSALAEKKFLESKDRLFKMVESGQMSQEHFINVINELTEDPTDAEQVSLKQMFAADEYIDKKKAGKPWYYSTPDEKDWRNEFRAKYKNNPLKNWKTQDALDGGIPQGTTKGGPSKLRQRQMGMKGAAQMAPAPKDYWAGRPKTRPDGTPFNTMAPPPTGPGGDEALPRSKPQRRPKTRPGGDRKMDSDNRAANPNYGTGKDAKGMPYQSKPKLGALRAMTTGEIAARDYGGDVKGGEFGGIMADPVKRVGTGTAKPAGLSALKTLPGTAKPAGLANLKTLPGTAYPAGKLRKIGRLGSK